MKRSRKVSKPGKKSRKNTGRKYFKMRAATVHRAAVQRGRSHQDVRNQITELIRTSKPQPISPKPQEKYGTRALPYDEVRDASVRYWFSTSGLARLKELISNRGSAGRNRRIGIKQSLAHEKNVPYALIAEDLETMEELELRDLFFYIRNCALEILYQKIDQLGGYINEDILPLMKISALSLAAKTFTGKDTRNRDFFETLFRGTTFSKKDQIAMEKDMLETTNWKTCYEVQKLSSNIPRMSETTSFPGLQTIPLLKLDPFLSYVARNEGIARRPPGRSKPPDRSKMKEESGQEFLTRLGLLGKKGGWFKIWSQNNEEYYWEYLNKDGIRTLTQWDNPYITERIKKSVILPTIANPSLWEKATVEVCSNNNYSDKVACEVAGDVWKEVSFYTWRRPTRFGMKKSRKKKSKIKKSRKKKSRGKLSIQHASRHRSGGYGSEYIYPKVGSIDITSHGMGSGIYGLSETIMKKSLDPGGKIHTYKISTPFILNNKDCDIYQTSSKQLNRKLEKEKRNFLLKKDRKQIASVLSKSFIDTWGKNTKFKRTTIQKAIEQFMEDYYTRKNYVKMPINYILEAHGYNGVYAVEGTNCDRWSKGSVKFVPYHKTGAKLISKLYARIGTTKRWVDLNKRKSKRGSRKKYIPPQKRKKRSRKKPKSAI